MKYAEFVNGIADVSLLERCHHFRGCYVQAPIELGPEGVSLLEMCPHFRGCYVQASMELGPEDVSLLERCPHFRGCYVQAPIELGPEGVSLLERCPHFRGVMYRLQWSWDLKMCPPFIIITGTSCTEFVTEPGGCRR